MICEPNYHYIVKSGSLHRSAVLALGIFICFLVPTLWGHGTVTSPISRVYAIYLEGPESPDSPAAQAAIGVSGPGPYYTWNQVSKNVSNYAAAAFASSYSSAIPDGKLASGDSGSGLDFSGLDLASADWNWPATSASAGPLDIVWTATAPHDPSFFKVWVSTPDYDPTSPLAWGTMSFLGRYDLDSEVIKVGNEYRMTVTLPEREGRHVLYVAWQRVDPVGEVFFATSDLLFGDGGANPEPGKPPNVSIESSSVSETVGNVSVTVSLSKSVPDGESASVSYATSDLTAIAGADYTARSGMLTFLPGELSKSIFVPIADDSDEESDEAFNVLLSNSINLSIGNSSANVTIADDDTPVGGGSLFDKTQDWGTGYQGWLAITNPGPSMWTNPTVTFDLDQPMTWFGGGARTDDGAGHHTVSGLGSIAPSDEIRFDLVVQPVSVDDPRGPTNVRVNGTPLEALPPFVSVVSVSRPEGDEGNLSVELSVSLSGEHDRSVYVSYATGDGSAIAGTDYQASSGQFAFAVGETEKTISITYDGDAVSEGDETFQVLLAGVSGQSPPRFANGGQLATVTLTDDDGVIGFAATGGTIIEGDSDSLNLSFRMSINREPKQGEAVSIDYRAHGHGASMGSDFASTSGTHVFSVGETTGTVVVPILGDTTDEALEIVTLHFQNPSGLSMTSSVAVGQIIDNNYSKAGLGGQRVVAYVDGTSGAFDLPPADRVTHVMYAFANLNADGSLTMGGPGPASAVALKEVHPDLKVVLSIGGWTWSANFSSVAGDANKRAAFASACRAIITSEDLDGIDLDWEWPGVAGGPGTTPAGQDGANYTLLVAALRAELDALELADGVDKHYEITAFTAASPNGIAQLQLAQLEPLMDFLNVQGYDLHGPWDSVTGHNAGLFDNSGDPGDDRLNIDSILAQYLVGGFPRSKLLIGAPFYGRVFNGVGDTANGAFQSHAGSGTDPLYRDLLGTIQTTPRHWDALSKVPYLYNQGTGQWTSYDDPEAMHEKALYSVTSGYGGVFFWRNGGDTDDHQLLTTISDTLAAPDADGDNLTDAWERKHFGSIAGVSALEDPDGDGQSNAVELAAKTDPGDVADYLRLENGRVEGLDYKFDLPTEVGVTYQLMRSTDLIEWMLDGEQIVGDGNVVSLTVSQDPRLFVRVELVSN